MKVILLAPLPPPNGGIASWTVRICNNTLKNDWTIDVVDEKLTFGREVFGSKTKKNLFHEAKRTLRIWKELNQKLKDEDAAVVHSCIPAGVTSMLRETGCLIITKLHKKKFVVHFRCTVPNMVKSKISKVVFKILAGNSDAVFVLNKKTEEFTAKYCKTKTYLIPNFVSEDEIDETFTIREELKAAIYVGGVIRSKGCMEIVNAAKLLPQINFILVGRAAEDIAAEAEKLENIQLLGLKNKEEIQQLLHDSDVFLFPSYFQGEGFSNALVEAMAYGLPCIASDWAANSDMLDNGIIVPIQDEKALAKAIEDMKPYEIRKRMSQVNIKKVREEYCAEIVLSKYVDAYEELIKE